MIPTRVFIHGLFGSSQGTKASFFRERYPDMLIEDFHGTLHERLEKLERLLAEKDRLILVGSSFGGLMAAMYALAHGEKVQKVVLLAPALGLREFEPYLALGIEIPVTIYHGTRDEVVPPGPVYERACMVFKRLTFHHVDDDHVLSRTFTRIDWDELLKP